MEYKTSTLEKPIVRESKVRNVFSKVCKKELFYTNLKVNSSSEELLKCSNTLFAYPSSIGGGSCLAVSNLKSYGKAPDSPFCIKGHTDPISCFEFSPFNDHVVATGSRDCSIKVWEIPEEGMTQNLNTPLLSLPKQNKRVTGVYFHPSVDSLFMSATMEHTVEMWDLGQEGKIIQKLTGNEDLVMSLGWNVWTGGNMVATSSRDKKMRLYDARSSSAPVHEVLTHEGAQGFKLTWADYNGLDLLCTVGANKSAQRQLYLWDPRHLSGQQGPITTVNITTDSSILNPFYDYATNILYLGGKGDGIYYYEIEKTNAHLIGKASFGNVTQSSIALLPKKVVDVGLCEVDRFLRLTSNWIEMVSFIVPRKSQLFQEDIFPAAPSGNPTTDCDLWFNDKTFKVIPDTISLKPEGLLSIYEVSEEEGGKNKQKDKLEQLASQLTTNETFLLEGEIKLEVEGWLFNTFQPRYLKIIKDKIYCFLNEDAAQSIWETPVVEIKYVDIYDPNEAGGDYKEWINRFNILLKNGKEYKIECNSIEQRDAWITSIHAHREMKLSVDAPKDSPTLNDFHVVNNSSNNSPAAPSLSQMKSEATRSSNALQQFAVPAPKEPSSSNNNNTNATSNNSTSNTPSSTPTLTRKHSVLSRNPSFTSLKLSGGLPPPPGTNTNSSSSTTTSTPSTPTSTTPSLNQIKQSDIIIEGMLYEMIPGFLWNSNIEKWYVVSEGMLYSFKSKQSKSTGEQPLETFHLEKAISVTKTKEIFKMAGFSFQLATPNRIVHLLAKTKEERQSWLSVLRQNLKSSGESKPNVANSKQPEENNLSGGEEEANNNPGGVEEEEEETLEGQISRKLPGLFSMWGSSYLSLLAEDLFLSKNKLAITPELRIQLSTISNIKKLSPNEFTLYDNANAVVCNFKTVPPTEDFDDCSRWVEGLEAARKRSIDIIKMFGISDKDEVDEEALAHRFLDLTALKNGKQKLLMQIKGRRKVRVQMTKLDGSSLNRHNSFVLDAGPRIFIWSGAKSSRVNRAKALDLANRIRQKERGGKATLISLDEGREDSSDFWEIMGNKPAQTLNSPTTDEQDVEFSKIQIYRIGLDIKKNALRARLAWEGTDWRLPNKEILNTKFVYVLDCDAEIFIWVGKESSSSQRKMGVKVAMALFNQPQRKDWTKITRVFEFGENNLFKEKFANYPGMLPISTTKQEIKSHVAITKSEHTLAELVAKLHNTTIIEEKIFTDEPSGRVKIWKIEDFDKIDHPQDLYSQFYCGDSYIVLYTYTHQNKETHVIYYYLGRDSSINEKGTSAYLTVDLHESLKGTCTQTRVVQNKECRNFLNLFKKKMIVHKGKFGSYDHNKPGLYEIRGQDDIDIRAVEVDLSAKFLNSHHSFILRHPSQSILYVWNGLNSTDKKKTNAIQLAQNMNSSFSIETVQEGSEPAEFWNVLGGKSEYFNEVSGQKLSSVGYQPRLFICSNATGINEINEETSFIQDDLEIGSVAILDVLSHIYLWIGTRAPHRTKKVSMESVLEFCKTSKLGHSSENTQVLIINPYEEPLVFKSYFRAWCTSKYPKNKLPLKETPGIPVQNVLKDYLKEIYTYEELLADPLPAGVDATKLDTYLSDEDFEKVFQMTRKEWEKIPQWKRENIKKGLFLF
eukprot:gene8291-10187_t